MALVVWDFSGQCEASRRFVVSSSSNCGVCREQIAMSRGLTDVPMVVVGNKTDLLSRDMALDKFRHDVVNKVGHRDLIL